MRHFTRLFASLSLVAASSLFAQAAFAQSAPAQTAPPTPPTYKVLMEQGLAGTTVQPETVIVTLQKGPLTASCWIALSDWQVQDIGAFPCNLLH
jgi:hypothetical protein